MATSPAPAPVAAARPSPGVRTSVLDPIAWLDAAVRALFGISWYIAASIAPELSLYVQQQAFSFTVLWSTVYAGLAAVRQLVVTTGTALAAYWDKVIQPLGARIRDTLEQARAAVVEVLAPVRDVLDWLVRTWLRQAVTWLGQLAGVLLGIPGALRRGRDVVLLAVGAVLSALFQAETRAHVASGVFTQAHNLVALWLNHVVHPAGVIREDPWVWAAQTYFGDIQAVLVNNMVALDPPGLQDELRARLPVVTLGQVLERWDRGDSSRAPEVLAALARLAGAGGA